MNMQHDNSFSVLTLAAFGLLATTMIKELSPESSLQLADSAPGRIVLHLVCAWRGRDFRRHWQGIQREFKHSRKAGW